MRYIPPKIMRNALHAPINFTIQHTKAVLSGYVRIFFINLCENISQRMPKPLSKFWKNSEHESRKGCETQALERLLTQTHPDDKVLVFTQFADTVRYVKDTLSERGITQIAAATGDSADPTALARRFSPISNIRKGVAAPKMSYGCSLAQCPQ